MYRCTEYLLFFLISMALFFLFLFTAHCVSAAWHGRGISAVFCDVLAALGGGRKYRRGQCYPYCNLDVCCCC
ncbi:hypothetical protein EDD21DRAFT_366141 [Dissophora ornata]|nr:hypothetical protein EDD21DRAFT_366141 [Dissophora ornata]